MLRRQTHHPLQIAPGLQRSFWGARSPALLHALGVLRRKSRTSTQNNPILDQIRQMPQEVHNVVLKAKVFFFFGFLLDRHHGLEDTR